MSEPYGSSLGVYVPPATARPLSDAPRDLTVSARIAVAVAVIGGALGVVWAAWSPPRPRAFLLGSDAIQPAETESWIASDGRFAAISIVVGIVVALLVWTRVKLRGPIAVVLLALGCLAGSGLMALVGRLLGGGTLDGKPGAIVTLPLSVHAQGLYFVEAGVAVLVYSLCAAFAVRDDLGRRDPLRLLMLRRRIDRKSIERGPESQDAGRHGDGTGGTQ